MKIYYTTFPETAEKILALAGNGEEGLVADVADRVWILTGSVEGTYDPAEAAGYDVFRLPYAGGTGIIFPGDLSAAHLSAEPTQWGNEALEAIQAYLTGRGIRAKRAGNDLLLYDPGDPEGRKVASHAEGALEGTYFSGLRVSIATDMARVKRICTKPMEKKPGRLDRYGITAADILAALQAAGLLGVKA